jgi:cytochrome d ubiquinol oxidase subunit I
VHSRPCNQQGRFGHGDPWSGTPERRDGIDAFLLSRIQFASTVSFHIVFPAFTIGLSAYIATLLGLWLKTGDQKFHLLARFWTKIFAVSFAMGWSRASCSPTSSHELSRFSVAVGNVIGPLIAMRC